MEIAIIANELSCASQATVIDVNPTPFATPLYKVKFVPGRRRGHAFVIPYEDFGQLAALRGVGVDIARGVNPPDDETGIQFLEKRIARIVRATIGVAEHHPASGLRQTGKKAGQTYLLRVIEILLGIGRKARRGVQRTIRRVKIDERMFMLVDQLFYPGIVAAKHFHGLQGAAVVHNHALVADGRIGIASERHVEVSF